MAFKRERVPELSPLQKSLEDRKIDLEKELKPVFEKHRFGLGAKLVYSDQGIAAVPIYVNLDEQRTT